MLDDSALFERLMEAGLTGYQARAYVTLLRLRKAKVLPLARESGIPRNKLYHVLEELVQAKLVEIASPDPLEYAPRAIEPFIEARIERLGEILATLRPLSAPLQKPETPASQA